MHRTDTGTQILDYPDEVRDVTISGVRLVRTSELHAPGVYEATVERSGRVYVVTRQESKRRRWRITFGGARVTIAQSLPAVAAAISLDDAARGPSLARAVKH